MPTIRTAEDYLRSEYVRLVPAMQRTSVTVETEVRHLLLGLTLDLDRYERLSVKTRIKDCESAIDALRRRQQYGLFDQERADQYTLTALPDLSVFVCLHFHSDGWKRLMVRWHRA